MNQLLTIKEATAVLRISKTALLKLVHGEQIPHLPIGRRILLRREDIDTFIRRGVKGLKSAA